MPLIHLEHTPAEPVHRVLKPLLWESEPGRPRDGQVEMRDVNGVMTLVLLRQPYKPKRYMGVSLFVPQCDQRILDGAHAYLNKDMFGCAVSVPNTPLPKGLQMVNDHDFRLPLFGSRERIVVGQHYTLFAAEDMTVVDFEREYEQLMKTCLPCGMEGGGVASLKALADPYFMPSDPLSAVSVMALEEAALTAEPNTALFATLFALDMRACDTDFEEVLMGCGNRASLVAAALDMFVARDPQLRTDVLDAQDALEAELPDYKPQGCNYEPFWTVLPFQFRNTYSDESYDAEVKVCAPGFQRDNVLKSEVRTRATKLFEELASSANQVDSREDKFNHNTIPFEIKCLKLDELNSPAPVTQQSLDMASGMTPEGEPAAFDPEDDSKKKPGAPY